MKHSKTKRNKHNKTLKPSTDLTSTVSHLIMHCIDLIKYMYMFIYDVSVIYICIPPAARL